MATTTAPARPTRQPRAEEVFEVVFTMLGIDNPEKLVAPDQEQPHEHTRLVLGDIVHKSVFGDYFDRFLKMGAIKVYYGPIEPIMQKQS